jgi:anti-sigma-K factor RskA
MTFPRLTAPNPAATSSGMMRRGMGGSKSGRRVASAAAVLVIGATALAGCISVNAPDKPIVIELNINIKQEVIYRLADDVKKNIDANSDIF